MIEKKIDEIERIIKDSNSIEETKKDDLLKLIAILKTEVVLLSKSNKDDAERITKFADLTAHEAASDDKKEKLLEISIEGLKTSVKDFEVSHPKLSEIVGSIVDLLSSIGI